MTLHIIIKILSSDNLHEHLSYAQDLICFFIKSFITLRGIQNVSHIIIIIFMVLFILWMMPKHLDLSTTLVPLNSKTICKYLKSICKKRKNLYNKLYEDALKKKKIYSHQLLCHIALCHNIII